MATYDELARYVMDWSNRSTDVLSYSTIRQCIRYAHDECYRTLRIAPLEYTGTGTVTATDVDNGYLVINDDLVEFIQLRKTADRDAGNFTPDRFTVAESKPDIRTALGDNVTLYSDYSFTREGNNIWIFPRLTLGETWELYYYRRLPEANERFDEDEIGAFIADGTISGPTYQLLERYYVEEPNNLSDLQETDPSNIETITGAEIITALNAVDGVSLTIADTDLTAGTSYIRALKRQWLRDENEKALLFGGLYHAFDYLDEPEQTQKYQRKFEMEIDKLNKEDMMRQYSGGNIQVNFYNRLI